MPFVLIRVFLEILWLGCITHLSSYLAYLVEPLALIIAVIVAFQISSENFGSILIADIFRDSIFNSEVIIKEIADELKNLSPVYQILSWLVAAASEIQYLSNIFFVAFKERQYFRSEFPCPLSHEAAELCCRDFHKNIL